MAVPVPMAVRCFGHALVRRVEVQVGVRPERAALRELSLLLRRVRVHRRACHGGARGSGPMRRVERVWGGCREGVGRVWRGCGEGVERVLRGFERVLRGFERVLRGFERF